MQLFYVISVYFAGFLVIAVQSGPTNLLEAYFKHRAAHNTVNNRLLLTNGRNHLDPDYDLTEAREPGSFVTLHENRLKGWSGLSQPVASPHRDELWATAMIQKLHTYSKRLAGQGHAFS
uniref:Uncharacterized protein n=1 Tax=Caenorhabditis japonica TaxID=281687 RepID=A0A8R1HUM7_CAEJA